MKFVYVDETGGKDQSDAFVMTGLLIDAYSLRICTVTFDDMIRKFLAGIVRRRSNSRPGPLSMGQKAGVKSVMWNERNLSAKFAVSQLSTQGFIPSPSRFKHLTTPQGMLLTVSRLATAIG